MFSGAPGLAPPALGARPVIFLKGAALSLDRVRPSEALGPSLRKQLPLLQAAGQSGGWGEGRQVCGEVGGRGRGGRRAWGGARVHACVWVSVWVWGGRGGI